MSVLKLSVISVKSFEVNGKTMCFKEPLMLQEQLDSDSESLIYAECPELRLLVFAEFQDDIEELICEELANKWEWIVESDDNELTKDAVEVKKRFLTMIEEG